MKQFGVIGNIPKHTETLMRRFGKENGLDIFQTITIALNKMFLDCVPKQNFGEYEDVLGVHLDAPIQNLTFRIPTAKQDELQADIDQILRLADIDDLLQEQGRLLEARLSDTDLHRDRVFPRAGGNK